MNHRILITGSQGTLGQILAAELRNRGHEVYGIDQMHGEGPQHWRCDIANYREVERNFKYLRPTIVYHLAAEFGRMNGEHYYEKLWINNAIGTRNIIEACLKHQSHLVFASSSEAYGTLADSNELQEELLNYKVPKFHNEYALSKWTNEKQIQIAMPRGLKATILRFFNAYGPGERYSPYRSVVCLFIYRLMKGLPITIYRNYHRVFMYVTDWSKTVANVADRLEFLHNGDVFNIGGREYCSVEVLADKIVKLLGGSNSHMEYLDKEKANITNKRPNIDRAIMHLGHNPATTLDVGLPLTIEWMRKEYGA